jgi:hypothetical protein
MFAYVPQTAALNQLASVVRLVFLGAQPISDVAALGFVTSSAQMRYRFETILQPWYPVLPTAVRTKAEILPDSGVLAAIPTMVSNPPLFLIVAARIHTDALDGFALDDLATLNDHLLPE